MPDFDRLRPIYSQFHPDRVPGPDEYVDFNGLRVDAVLEPLFNELVFSR